MQKDELSFSDSSKFELKIARIRALLAKDGEIVVFNDHIKDPHNKGQIRQVDVSVKTQTGLVHIECRNRARRQDVDWIEGLIGRRQSLGAEKMIAVSSSGFTEGAIQKAQAFGIFLYTLEEASDDAISSWTANTRMFLFGNVVEFALFDIETYRPAPQTIRQKLVEFFRDPNRTIDLLRYAENLLRQDQRLWPTSLNGEVVPRADMGRFSVTLDLESDDQILEHIKRLRIHLSIKPFTREVSVPSTQYFKAKEGNNNYEAIVEHFALGYSHVISDDERAIVVVDMSSLHMEPNHILSGWLFAFETPKMINQQPVTLGLNKYYRLINSYRVARVYDDSIEIVNELMESFRDRYKKE